MQGGWRSLFGMGISIYFLLQQVFFMTISWPPIATGLADTTYHFMALSEDEWILKRAPKVLKDMTSRSRSTPRADKPK